MAKVRSVYTDGSANTANQQGGWAFVELNGNDIINKASGHETDTTNNRMEITALLEAIAYYKSLNTDDSFIFYTDSQYVQKSATIWLEGWQKSNWKGGTIKNIDLWQRYIQLNDGTLNFSIRWVKGHANSKGNIIADQMAYKAYLTIG